MSVFILIICFISILFWMWRAQVAPPVIKVEDEEFYPDKVLPLSRQLGIGVEVETDLEKQLVFVGSESCKMINLKTIKFEEVAFTLGVL